jgi:hypothetical protein
VRGLEERFKCIDKVLVFRLEFDCAGDKVCFLSSSVGGRICFE